PALRPATPHGRTLLGGDRLTTIARTAYKIASTVCTHRGAGLRQIAIL
ncbi:MAG: hypothetical protein HC901_01340, partial [Bdellovibrionaceae bacterium]|nr:hypothetical protein [Pseudobdellovibrionaceae bacterium]